MKNNNSLQGKLNNDEYKSERKDLNAARNIVYDQFWCTLYTCEQCKKNVYRQFFLHTAIVCSVGLINTYTHSNKSHSLKMNAIHERVCSIISLIDSTTQLTNITKDFGKQSYGHK